MLTTTTLYFFADEISSEKVAELTSEQQSVAGGAGAAALGSGAILSEVPQKLVRSAGRFGVRNFGGKMVTPEEMEELSKKHNIAVEAGERSKFTRDTKGNRKIILGKETGNQGTFAHELGHANDKGIKSYAKLKKGSLEHTLAKLRNEGVANINAVRQRGLKQIPHALASYGGYLASAAQRHKKGLAGISAIPLGIGGSMLPGAMEKEAVLTPKSALKWMDSPSPIKKKIGYYGARIQGAAANPAVTDMAQKATDGAFAGPDFAMASAAGSGARHLAKKYNMKEMAEGLGVEDVASNHGDAFTPAGFGYAKLKALAAMGIEWAAEALQQAQ